jgi:hypothetical protein
MRQSPEPLLAAKTLLHTRRSIWLGPVVMMMDFTIVCDAPLEGTYSTLGVKRVARAETPDEPGVRSRSFLAELRRRGLRTLGPGQSTVCFGDGAGRVFVFGTAMGYIPAVL